MVLGSTVSWSKLIHINGISIIILKIEIVIKGGYMTGVQYYLIKCILYNVYRITCVCVNDYWHTCRVPRPPDDSALLSASLCVHAHYTYSGAPMPLGIVESVESLALEALMRRM